MRGVVISFMWKSNGDVIVYASRPGSGLRAAVKLGPLRTLDESIELAKTNLMILEGESGKAKYRR